MELSVLTNDRTPSKTWGSSKSRFLTRGAGAEQPREWEELTWSQALLLSGSTWHAELEAEAEA